MIFRTYREFLFPFERSPNTMLPRCSILISFDITSRIALAILGCQYDTRGTLVERRERVRQGEKGVTLQAGKTDYSDCRRVRLAGWATPSFWQQRIPLVMSSNERASFISRSRGVCTSFEKKKEREERRRDREKREERKKNENREKARGAEVEKLGVRIMEYVCSKGGEKTVSGLRMIEIDGRIIDWASKFSPSVENYARNNARC